jgi:hypothetical protein
MSSMTSQQVRPVSKPSEKGEVENLNDQTVGTDKFN